MFYLKSIAYPTGNGNCITATNNADGAEVVIQDCGANATANNSWLVPDGEGAVGTLQIFGDKVDPIKPKHSKILFIVTA